MAPALDIQLVFTNAHADTYGYNFHDYFRDDGLERARNAGAPYIAEAILAETYKGPDIHGIGVTWEVA